ncbi:MAG: Glycogen synthase [Chlamydiales bacterium]|nr:Glycogen synthase [Chlamydiales bacterium]
MKRIIFLKPRANQTGGLEKYTLCLLRAFAAKGCEVILLTTGNVPIIEGVQTISLCPDSKFSLRQLLRFNNLCKRWLKHAHYDSVFGMERTSFQTHYRAGNGVHAVYLKRRELIDSKLKTLSFTFNPLHRQLLKLEKQAFECPKLQTLFTNSAMVREEILQNYAVSPQKIKVIHNGVEWNEWEIPFEQSFPIKKSKPFHFLFVGNAYRRKGLLFLLKGLQILHKEDFKLTVIGKDRETPFFQKEANKRGLRDKIVFKGPQTNLIPYYQQADALVIPSIYDPFANVTVEALAMGLFVVTSKFNGGKEILHPFSGEVIEDLTSSLSVATSLKKALEHPKDKQLALNIRNSIQELDFSHQLDKIVSETYSK